MSAAVTISLLRAHCDANDKRERATFSIASIRELLDFVDDCAATIRPFPPLPSREVGGKASMTRELLGAVVDDVFDGAIEDPSVIEEIYASIKQHEAMRSTDTEPLELPYKNWRGEIFTRKIQPIRLEFGATEWHPEPQWLLVATDIEKNVERSFALKDFNPQKTAPAVAVTALELDGVSDALAHGKGIWRTCTGCHEDNEGYPTGPYSDTLKCHLGGGCFECGGVGAVWDTTDYEDMGNFIASAQVQDLAGWQHEEKLTPEEAWTILCETSDITSPEEYPNHALITFEQLQSYMERAIIADGYQLVPKEPTQEMLQCGADSCCSLTVHGAHGVYRSMLSASLASEGGGAL